MNWNEKIDLLKKEFSQDDFSVPHVARKEILRKIETQFIKREEGYYDLNNFNDPFCNWWEGLNFSKEEQINIGLENTLRQLIKPNQTYWIACEFSGQIMIYKSKLSPAIKLISMGQSKTNTYHIIGQKLDFLVGLKSIDNLIKLRYVGHVVPIGE